MIAIELGDSSKLVRNLRVKELLATGWLSGLRCVHCGTTSRAISHSQIDAVSIGRTGFNASFGHLHKMSLRCWCGTTPCPCGTTLY